MKQAEVKIKKRLALSLMMIYLAVSLANLFLLPKYNKHQTGRQNHLKAATYWLYNGANNSAILFHRASKTIIEKRQNLTAFFKAAATVFLLILFSSVGRSAFTQSDARAGLLYLSRQQYTYLNFCSLRI
ncbi:hypothetical protein [Mucilaginibacter gotjawali]|uniref:Uncharacterized protein n=2 Tax=Mucilaginibacter gotjawali TaxID=1550579 RepID=A0A110B1L3_9SPHI|nr:hypothetical protein [Mucilaginibacter gotjawali]MBB3057222.1 hypothetical protein [Mucilaginibacter gotjawali]BAU53011.1 hypothetical protein MgSA37_01178 [Mucilaginibacter gotjawali]